MRKKRGMGGSRAPLWSAGLLLLGALALVVGCSADHKSGATSGKGDPVSRGRATEKYAQVPVQSQIVKVGALVTDHTAAGTIVPVMQSQVAAQVSGVVTKVDHLAGAWVSAGEEVVKLDDSQLRLSVAAAQAALGSVELNVQKDRAQLDLADLTVTRDQSLIKQTLIPQSQLDADTTNASVAKQTYLADRSAVAQATAALKTAELNLRYSSVRAPFPGQLAAVNVTPGEFVGQNTPVFVLVSPEREINFNVAPGDANALPVGAPVDLVYDGQSYPARVSQAPSAPINGVVPMVALLSSAATPPYGSVGTVSYRLSLGTGVLVPIAALQTTGNQEYVFVVRDGKAETQKLTVVAESGTTAAVDGVPSQSQVVLNPPPGLLEGSPVRAVGGAS